MMKPFQSCVPKISLVLVTMLIAMSRAAAGQALPAAEASPVSTGFSLPTTLGTLQYAISASQSLTWGYYGNQGAAGYGSVTGDLAYLSASKREPFSMVLSGGHSWSESGQPSANFVNFGLSQVLNLGRWNMVLADAVSYLPETPTTGLSGIAGVGDLGVNPVQIGPDSPQGVLTAFSNRVDNTATLSIQRQLTGKTSANVSGSYILSRFVNNGNPNASNAGLDSNLAVGGGGFNHQIDARTGFGANYSYERYSYSGSELGVVTPSYTSQTVSAQFTHQFTRKWSMSAAAGPEWVTIKSTGQTGQLSAYADVSTGYVGHFYHAAASFVRSTSSGYGIAGGAISDGVTASVGRVFAVVWNFAGTAAYTRSSELPAPGVIPFSVNTTVASAQISRAIMRNLSGYTSFTIEKQANTGLATVDVFTGAAKVVGFGLTYSPSSKRVGRP
jgi:hypothetical protein